MGYLALYRKYRPQTFDEVYGQEAIVQTLQNQIKADRLGHAYLFSGPRGTGKTSIAKIFAKAVNCTGTGTKPCLQCECCKATQDGINIDIVEIDAASNNGVDNIRELIEECSYLPQRGKKKVYIIDEVHMLSGSAFNALLKTLEEPPSHVLFILATTEFHKVPPTIYSRCQRFQFKLMDENTIVHALQDICIKEKIEWTKEGLEHIAKLAKGGMRDAISFLDQAATFGDKHVTEDIVSDVFGEPDADALNRIIEYVKQDNPIKALDEINELFYEGKNLQNVAEGLYDCVKNELFDDIQKGIEHGHEFHERAMRILGELSQTLKYNSSRTQFDIAVIRLCKPEMEEDTTSLKLRIQKLEQVVGDLASGSKVEFEAPKQIDTSGFISLQYACDPLTLTIYNK
jgi:DNA polymerase-3 subunit gamma/tau